MAFPEIHQYVSTEESPYRVDPYAVEVLAGELHCVFDYLLSHELAEQIAMLAIRRIALMQEYSGNKVWSKKETP